MNGRPSSGHSQGMVITWPTSLARPTNVLSAYPHLLQPTRDKRTQVAGKPAGQIRQPMPMVTPGRA